MHDANDAYVLGKQQEHHYGKPGWTKRSARF
jgi:hypothetical protein